jgi:iron(III) transport system permease protein
MEQQKVIGSGGDVPARASLGEAMRGWWRVNGWPVTLTVILLLLVAVPIISVIAASLRPGGLPLDNGWTVKHYTSIWGAAYTYRLLGNTLMFAFGSTVFSILVGGTLAWLLERTDVPGRGLFRAAILMPMMTPPLLLAIGWVLLTSPNIGLVTHGLNHLIGDEAAKALNMYSLGGMIFVQGLANVPLSFLILAPAMRNMDPSYEEAAMTSGATFAQTLRLISLPFLTPSILSLVILQLIVGMLTFDVPSVVGMAANIRVMSTEIFFLMNPAMGLPEYGKSAAFNSSLFVVLALGLALYFRFTRQADRFSTISGRGYRGTRFELGSGRGLATGFVCFYFLLAVILPFAALVWVSTTPYFSGFQVDLLDKLTMKAYVEIFTTPRIATGTINSLIIALTVSAGVVLVALLVAWTVIRSHVPWVRVIDVISMIPMGIPHLMMGVALIFIFFSVQSLSLYGTIWSIAIGHLIVYMPEACRMMQVAILQIHKELEEAALVSGATIRQNLMRIVMPLVAPMAGGIFLWVFVHSLREFSIAVMMKSGRNEVLSTMLFSYWDNGKPETAAAIAIVMMLFLALVIALSNLFGLRRKEL